MTQPISSCFGRLVRRKPEMHITLVYILPNCDTSTLTPAVPKYTDTLAIFKSVNTKPPHSNLQVQRRERELASNVVEPQLSSTSSSSALMKSKTSLGGNRGGKDGVEIKGLTATWAYGAGSVTTHPKDGPPNFRLVTLESRE